MHVALHNFRDEVGLILSCAGQGERRDSAFIKFEVELRGPLEQDELSHFETLALSSDMEYLFGN
jgi:hypothetical protein